MSLFLQYQLGQALGDLGGGGAAADAAGSAFGFGLGLMMPYMLARAFYPPPTCCPRTPMAYPATMLPAPPVPRYCGHCGMALVAGACYCGHCGEAVHR